RGALPVEILQQLVQMQHDILLFRHGRLVAVETVDHDCLDPFAIDGGADAMRELARRQLGGIHLLDEELALLVHRGEVDPERLGAGQHEAEFLVEDEKGGTLAARDRGGDVVEHEDRFAGAGGADDQRARSLRDAAAQKRVELLDAAGDDVAGKAGAVLGRDEARVDGHAALLDTEIVIAAAKALAATFDDTQPAALAAVNRRELIQMDDAVRDAMN